MQKLVKKDETCKHLYQRDGGGHSYARMHVYMQMYVYIHLHEYTSHTNS